MELKFILEAILFSAQKPHTPKELRDLLNTTATVENAAESAKPFRKTKDEDIVAALELLQADHAAAQRSYRLACVAGAWQFVSEADYAPWLITLVGQKPRPPRLSAPALETMAIIAYRQPITRAEIEQIRGVAVDGVVATLLERGLIEQSGRAEVVGRPALYSTTALFLEYFGLRALEELPSADELRRIPVTKPESLLTVDPGLATATPELLSAQELGVTLGEATAEEAAPAAEASAPAEEKNRLE